MLPILYKGSDGSLYIASNYTIYTAPPHGDLTVAAYHLSNDNKPTSFLTAQVIGGTISDFQLAALYAVRHGTGYIDFTADGLRRATRDYVRDSRPYGPGPTRLGATRQTPPPGSVLPARAKLRAISRRFFP